MSSNNFIKLSREADILIEFAALKIFRNDVYLSTFDFTRWDKTIAVDWFQEQERFLRMGYIDN